MDVVLALVALCAVLLAIRLVRSRRRRLEQVDAARATGDPLGRDQRPAADAHGAVNRRSRRLRRDRSGG